MLKKIELFWLLVIVHAPLHSGQKQKEIVNYKKVQHVIRLVPRQNWNQQPQIAINSFAKTLFDVLGEQQTYPNASLVSVIILLTYYYLSLTRAFS